MNLYKVFLYGDLETVKKTMNDIEEYDFDYLDLDIALEDACEGGNLEVVQFLIDKGARYWHGGFVGACKGGHIDIVKLMIDKGEYGWNTGVYFAGLKGHRHIVDLMIEKSNGRLDNYKLLTLSVKYGWNDLIVNTVYKLDININRKQLGHRYDLLEVYKDKDVDEWEGEAYNETECNDMKVKMFDRNLFFKSTFTFM
jgi:hypothetical protein